MLSNGGLTVFEIPQVPGYRHRSRSNKSVSASLVTTGYAVPLTLMNPYPAGAIFVDYLVRGRYPLIPHHPAVLDLEHLATLTGEEEFRQNPAGAGVQPGAAVSALRTNASGADDPGLKAIVETHE